MNRLSDHDRLCVWRGTLTRFTHVGRARNSLCGDEVWIDLVLADGVVQEVRFRGQGCVVSQACASMLCEGVEGKSVEEVLKATPEELMEFEIRELTLNRQRCALVGHEALLQALTELRGPSTTAPGDRRGGDVSA